MNIKKGFLSLSVAIIGAGALIAKTNGDPVLMTVNKKPVSLSEFDYLYQKNNAQQLSTQPVDEYLELFEVYKLKVADAEAEGLDKSESFQNEYAGYCRDLSEPYLTDTGARDSLIHLFYNRLQEDVDVSHIMLSKGNGYTESQRQKEILDSLRTEILAGRADFAATADQYSIDPGVKRNHGHMGYITAGSVPFSFEDMAYETPVGEISPVFDTPFGYHILRVNDRRQDPGQVKVQHILKLTQNLPEERQAAQKASIDSIYNVLLAGADFSAVAMAESEDPGSAKRGGLIDFFPSGRMVPEFEEVSFSLKNGEMSEPFATAYGYHIVKRLDWKGIEPFDSIAPKISRFIDRDERQYIPKNAMTNRLRAKYDAKVNSDVMKALEKEIRAAGRLDSAMVAAYSADERELISLKGNNGGATVSMVFSSLPSNYSASSADEALERIEKLIDNTINESVIAAERENLAIENAEYRNLLNEYRDGMLLFEISDRNVWSKSKNDVEGLNRYFEANRKKYSDWSAPKFKGYVIFATSDSIKELAQKYLADNKVDNSELVETLRKQFGKEIKVERVLAAKGENAIIDGLAFGEATPEPTTKWVAYFAYDAKIIDQPEEPIDCRGAVTTDYQNDLEQQWIKSLRKKYPVKIDKKVLKAYKDKISEGK